LDGVANQSRALRQASSRNVTQGRKVNEDVPATVIRHEEAIAPNGIEPFDRANDANYGIARAGLVRTP